MGMLKGRRPSSLEWTWASLWYNHAGDMPVPTIEYVFAPPRKWRFDFAHIDVKVAVEIDGGSFKPGGGRHGQDGDREKLNMASALGWLVFRYSGQMMQANPIGCVAQVAATIIERREGTT
jgi:hypothetical protein